MTANTDRYTHTTTDTAPPPSYAMEQRQQSKAAFLAAVQKTHRVKDACALTGIPESTVNSWREKDRAFKAALAQARQVDALVVRGIVQGGNNSTVAAQLQVNPSTISRRVSKIMRRFGVTSREQLHQVMNEVAR